jgi:hypothetical protein
MANLKRPGQTHQNQLKIFSRKKARRDHSPLGYWLSSLPGSKADAFSAAGDMWA